MSQADRQVRVSMLTGGDELRDVLPFLCQFLTAYIFKYFRNVKSDMLSGMSAFELYANL